MSSISVKHMYRFGSLAWGISAVPALIALSVSAELSAKDLYVAPGGNNAVTYAENSISTPWQTIEHGLYNLNAGDRLLIRAGTYTPKYPVLMAGDYQRSAYGGDPAEVNRAQSGTATAPVIVESYQGEKVVVDLAGLSSDYYMALDNKSYWTFRNLNFVNTAMVFVIGENYASTNNTFDGLTINMNRGGDNFAGIHVWGANGDGVTIKNNTIKGPGQAVHLNTAAVYVKGVNNLSILKNVLSDAPMGIYFKHRNSATSASQANIEVAYNYIFNTTRSSIEYNGSFSRIHDNVFGSSAAAAHFGDANGAAGADYNTITHNTFYGGGINYDSAVEVGDPFPGVVGNKAVDNVFLNTSESLRYSALANTNTFGKNLFPSVSAIVVNGGYQAVSVDSIVGVPTFVGGAAPASLAGYALAAGSLGKAAATDAKDMGADIAAILGTQAQTMAPKAPAALTVQ